MNKQRIVQVLIISIGIPIGMLLSNRSSVMHEAIDHPMAVQHTNMNHGLLDVSNDTIIPQITDITVSNDDMSGYNIEISTEHFEFTPEQVNKTHEQGKGHAHLYVNGNKYARLYGPYFHLPSLAAKVETIRVTLNANGHETLAIGDHAIDRIWRRTDL